jgi:hypothetical protein
VTRCGDRDDDVSEIERLVRETVVFAPEQEGDASLLCKRKEITRALGGTEKLALRCPAAGCESCNANTVGDCRLEGVEMLNRLEDFVRVVRDSYQAIAIIRNRPDEAKLMYSHVLHRANCRADVDGILRLVENDLDFFEKRHAVKLAWSFNQSRVRFEIARGFVVGIQIR